MVNKPAHHCARLPELLPELLPEEDIVDPDAVGAGVL